MHVGRFYFYSPLLCPITSSVSIVLFLQLSHPVYSLDLVTEAVDQELMGAANWCEVGVVSA